MVARSLLSSFSMRLDQSKLGPLNCLLASFNSSQYFRTSPVFARSLCCINGTALLATYNLRSASTKAISRFITWRSIYKLCSAKATMEKISAATSPLPEENFSRSKKTLSQRPVLSTSSAVNMSLRSHSFSSFLTVSSGWLIFPCFSSANVPTTGSTSSISTILRRGKCTLLRDT